MNALKKYDEPSRPRLDPKLKDRIDNLSHKLQIENMPLSNINNILCSIGIECIERSIDTFTESFKSNDFVKKFLKDLH
ncbi:MAG: hypothetical protein RL621_1885 [Bacteroidota bacterium]|jgi:hypothetical protein